MRISSGDPSRIVIKWWLGVIVQSTVHGSVKDVEETNLLYLENTKDLRFYTNEHILLLCLNSHLSSAYVYFYVSRVALLLLE
jgi:hypothetical protein